MTKQGRGSGQQCLCENVLETKKVELERIPYGKIKGIVYSSIISGPGSGGKGRKIFVIGLPGLHSKVQVS